MSRATRTNLAAVAFVVVLISLTLLTPGEAWRGAGTGALPVLLAYVVVMVLAEQWRLPVPGGLSTSAMASAAGLALAMTVRVPGQAFLLSGAEVLVTATVGQALGHLLLIGRKKVSWSDADVALDRAIRLFTVALTAAICRDLPLFGGQSLEIASTGWAGWQLALVLVAIGLLIDAFEGPLRSARRPSPTVWRRSAATEVRAHFPLGAAVTVTGVLVALSVSVLGVVAIPLVLSLLGLTDYAMRRYLHVQATYAAALRALAGLPEAVGFVEVGHAEQVRQVSEAVGRAMLLSERDLDTLTTAAQVHDIGQLALRRPLPGGATVQAAPKDQERIAETGADLLAECGPPGRLPDILRAQTTPYHRVLVERTEVPLEARIIKAASAFVDFGGRLGVDAEEEQRAAMERLYLGLGYEYDPRVVEALEKVLAGQDASVELP